MSKRSYHAMRLDELKAELSLRNAKTSGRKKELIERLEAYDRNANFGRKESLQPEYNMKLPDALLYRDLNSDSKIVPITMERLTTYLEPLGKNFDDSAKNLYKETYLCYLRVCQDQDVLFVKSACRAEMKKSVSYIVDVALTEDGHVQSCQCECAAGMGPQAHCKHVCTVIFACVRFNETGSVIVESTCTEKLQTFHHVKKYSGSPVKASSLTMPRADESTCITYDPRPAKFRNWGGYQSHFNNVCLNYPGISNLPISQTIPPANREALAHDHDYMKLCPEEFFLSSINVSTITDREVTSIEERTRGQNRNPAWHAERCKRLQSSQFGTICKATERADKHRLAANMINPKQFTSRACEHGKKYERDAILKYETIMKMKVNKCGLFVSKTLPFLGASPDGVCSSGVICEVKCPLSAANRKITTVSVPYLRVNPNNKDSFNLDTNHNYYYQVQGQMFCAKKQYCDFVVYTITDIVIIRIQRDDEFLSTMISKLEEFYQDHFKPELLKQMFYKPME